MRTKPTPLFRFVACFCLLAALLAPALPLTGGTPAILTEVALLFGEPAPCAFVAVPEAAAAPDPAVASSVPARAPPLA